MEAESVSNLSFTVIYNFFMDKTENVHDWKSLWFPSDSSFNFIVNSKTPSGVQTFSKPSHNLVSFYKMRMEERIIYYQIMKVTQVVTVNEKSETST